jgi:uncharacterized membrane protein
MPEQTTKTIIVGAPVSTAFKTWAAFENFPRFMSHIKSVKRTGDRTTHWVAEGPLGASVEWDAETTRYDENKRIAWKSRDDSRIKTSGQVTFNEMPKNQTEITVTLQYVAPGGAAGEKVAQLLANPEEKLEEDLLRFKSYVEGQVPAAAR